MSKDTKESPSSKEKAALEKATGQNSKPESKFDSKPDIQQLDKQMDVAELFRFGQMVTDQIKGVNDELHILYQRQSKLMERKVEIDLKLKPESRESKKIPGIGKQNSPNRTERKNLRMERKAIVRQLFLVGEEIEAKENRLSQLTRSSIKSEERGLLYDKANADNYLRKNPNLIRAKMLKAINTFRKTSDAETISKIRTLARSANPNRSKLFKQEFGNILEAIDESTFILCSGLLVDTLYEAARLTISSVRPSFTDEITELIMPEEG